MKYRFGFVLLSAFATLVSSWAGPVNAADTSSLASPSVDGAVQVTDSLEPTRGFVEPTVAVHPENPSTLAMLAGDATTGACAVYTSTNAGLSWGRARGTFAPKEYPKCVWANLGSFAALTFGPDGSLNIAFTGQPHTDWHSRIFFARSGDMGDTWTTTELPKQATDYANRRTGSGAASDVAVDPKDPNRVYVGYWSDYNNWIHEAELPIPPGHDHFSAFPARAMVAASTDGGKTFADPVDVHGEPNAWLTEPHIAIGTNGSVMVAYGDNIEKDHDGAPWAYPNPPIGHVWMATSTDGGKTYAKPQAVYNRAPASGWGWTQAAIPVVDKANGNVYVAWEATGPGPDGGEKTSGPAAVKLIRSSDQGKTWSEPVQINDVVPARPWSCCTFLPRLSVAPNGRLDVAFYDPRSDPFFNPETKRNRVYDVYYSYSTDEGRTWAKNVRVTDRGIDRSFGPSSSGYGIKGPLGIVSTNDAAFIAWDDTRNGSAAVPSQDIYFARARFTDTVLGAKAPDSDHGFVWGISGVAVGLGIAGLVLLVAVRTRNGSTSMPTQPVPMRDGA
jgi:hypothetical protein